MNELITAAKVAIRQHITHGKICRLDINNLRDAVERAERLESLHHIQRSKNPSKDLDQWLQSRVEDNPCASPPYDEEIWSSAQQEERKRIKKIVEDLQHESYDGNECFHCCQAILEKIDE